MTPRQRVIDALSFREPDRVPIDLGTTVTCIEIEAYRDLKRHLGIDAPDATFIRQHAVVDEAVLARLHVDTRHVYLCWPHNQNVSLKGIDAYVDEFGVKWSKPPSSPYWEMTGQAMHESNLDAIKKYQWPDPENIPHLDAIARQAKELYENTDYAVVLDCKGFGPFEQAWAVRGMEEFFLAMALEPVFAQTLIMRMAEYQSAVYRKVLAALGDCIHVVVTAEDLGGQQGPLISPKMYRTLIKPAHRLLYDTIRDHTDAKIFLHSCGAVREFIPDFIELGITCLNPVQFSAGGMDRAALKKEFGKDMVFWGGAVDTQKTLPFGKPEQVAAEVREAMELLAPGGGYVFTQVHNIQMGTPPENILAMFEAAQKFGSYMH